MNSNRFSKVAGPGLLGLFVGLTIAVFGCIEIEASPFYWTDYDFIGIDNIDCSLIKTDLKVRRVNRTCSGFSGTVDVKKEMTNDWEFEGVLLYSSKGNNQFVKLPYKIPKENLCSFFDGMFNRLRGPETVAEASDLPPPQKNVSLCTLYERKIYTIKDFAVGSEKFIKFLSPGYYKAEAIVNLKNSNESGKIVIHIRFY